MPKVTNRAPLPNARDLLSILWVAHQNPEPAPRSHRYSPQTISLLLHPPFSAARKFRLVSKETSRYHAAIHQALILILTCNRQCTTEVRIQFSPRPSSRPEQGFGTFPPNGSSSNDGADWNTFGFRDALAILRVYFAFVFILVTMAVGLLSMVAIGAGCLKLLQMLLAEFGYDLDLE